MGETEIEIRTLHSADEMVAVGLLLQQVWGSMTPLVDGALLLAIAHSGGYVAGAYDDGHLVGASFGFLGRYRTELALHSHVTGILPGVQHGGVGRAIKEHQRAWAARNDIGWVTWTFDPLVRRNAWFNLEVLGAHVAEYLVDFYGTMSDSINSGGDSDRLLVAWPTAADAPRPTAPPSSTHVEVPTPEDIVKLRRTDPTAAIEWRHRVRTELGGAIDRGGVVVGFTRDGVYDVAIPG